MKNIQKIEKKILTIRKITKITKAMKVIAIMKGKKMNYIVNSLQKHQELTTEIFSILQALTNREQFLNKKQSKTQANLYIFFTSDLGLCGSFNTRIYDTLIAKLTKNDDLIIIGSKGIKHFQYLNYNVVKTFLNSTFLLEGMPILISFLQEKYQKNDYNHFFIVYTLLETFLPLPIEIFTLFPLLPLPIEEQIKVSEMIQCEKEPQAFLDLTLPLYFQTMINYFYYQSRASEEKVRQFAMDNANENANEMLKDLKVQYNQVRQEKITKEILLVSQED